MSSWFRIAVERSAHQGYDNVRAVIVFNAKGMLPNVSKGVLPSYLYSLRAMQYINSCAVATPALLIKSSQRLGNKIRKHLPKYASACVLSVKFYLKFPIGHKGEIPLNCKDYLPTKVVARKECTHCLTI